MALHLKVPSMVCDGCVETVTEAIKALDADAKVDINLETKDVNADTTASESAVREAITAEGYTVN
ncbi:copper chaperone [filamentous cyanobacterium CCT1]|nr:copper chaperone [filamentous cyanobacterium CCT1]PSN76517.1 copper chaperone [filamentous cyanobacterium CCP4]